LEYPVKDAWLFDLLVVAKLLQEQLVRFS